MGYPLLLVKRHATQGNECSKWQQESQTMKALEFQFLL